MKEENKGYLASILMSLIMGMQYVFVKNLVTMPKDILLVLFIRFLISLIFVYGVITFRKKHFSFFKIEKEMLFLCVFNPVMNFIFQYIGVMILPVTIVSILIALIPLGNIIMSYVVLKEKITLKQIFYISLCIVGAILASVVSFKVNNVKGNIFIGIMFIVISILSRAYYQSKLKMISNSIDMDYVCFYQVYYGLCVFMVLFVIYNFFIPIGDIGSTILNNNFIFGILYLSILATVVVFYLNNYSIKKLSVISVGVMNNITVIISTLAGVIFLNEKFTLLQGVGILMIFIFSFMYYKDKGNNKKVS